jgi:DNA-binding MarR family transcriptional regulator
MTGDPIDSYTEPVTANEILVSDDLPFESFTGYLLIEVGKRAAAVANSAVAPLGLRLRHVRVLAAFASGTGTSSQQEASRVLGLDPNVVVDLIDDLERLGFAERKRNPKDRRRHVLAVTDQGQAALGQASAWLNEAEAAFFSAVSAEEKTVLHDILGRLFTAPVPSPGGLGGGGLTDRCAQG